MSDAGDDLVGPHQSWPASPTVEVPPQTSGPAAAQPTTIIAAGGSARNNSLLTMAAVLGVVIGLIFSLGVLGRGDLFIGVELVDGKPVVSGTGTGTHGSATTSDVSKPRPVLALQDNPLLAEGMSLPQITCQLPALGRSTEQLRAYYQGVIACLDNAWRPLLEQANEPFSTPKLELEAARSFCGDAPSEEEATAYYCSGDKIIFMPKDRLLEQAGLSQAAHLAVLAHEYGHHVQALSGILTAAYDKGEGFDKLSPEKLELTRRAELQANCFSGMFIASVAGRGSVSTKLARAAVDSFRDTIGDDTHGSVRHQVHWGKVGFDRNNAAACNTWLAPATEVS